MLYGIRMLLYNWARLSRNYTRILEGKYGCGRRRQIFCRQS